MDVAQHSEAVEAELTRFIEKRHDLRGKTEGEQLEEELWKESERRYLEIKQRRRVAAWFAHFCRMADSHRALSENYQRRAEELCEEGEMASGSVPQGEGTRSVSSIRRRRPPGTGEEMGAA